MTERGERPAGDLSATLDEVDEMERFNFVGVTTTKSAIMRVFPVWAAHLELNGVTMSGHDLPLHAAPERYRELVAGMSSRSADLGALVTSHKIDLFKACSDMFDYIDPYASLCGEVSCLSKRDGAFRAHAKDPIASGRSLDEFLPQGHWSETQAQALLFGAGGSNLAITLHLMTVRKPEDRPSRIIVVNRSPERLNSLRDLHEQLNSNVEVEYVQNADSRENDRILAEVPSRVTCRQWDRHGERQPWKSHHRRGNLSRKVQSCGSSTTGANSIFSTRPGGKNRRAASPWRMAGAISSTAGPRLWRRYSTSRSRR